MARRPRRLTGATTARAMMTAHAMMTARATMTARAMMIARATTTARAMTIAHATMTARAMTIAALTTTAARRLTPLPAGRPTQQRGGASTRRTLGVFIAGC